MKRSLTCMMTFLAVLCSAGWGVERKTGMHINDGMGILLKYEGSVVGTRVGLNIDVKIEIDSPIGIRSDFTTGRGSTVLSHVAYFYKYSAPNGIISYDYLTHQSSVNYRFDNPVNTSRVNVMGTAIIDSFSCTHLQHTTDPNSVNTYTSITDYWMSRQLPGFSQIVNAINANSAMMRQMNAAIFAWGGLVRMRSSFTDSKGLTQDANLRLIEAKTNMKFPHSDFDAPSN